MAVRKTKRQIKRCICYKRAATWMSKPVPPSQTEKSASVQKPGPLRSIHTADETVPTLY